MRKLLPLVCCMFLFATISKAQYVNIPDSNFRSYLIGQYPSCFNAAKQMDTTCSLILNEDSLNISYHKFVSLDGIQYFKNLTSLDCFSISLTYLPSLPNNLTSFNCSFNYLQSLPSLPNSLIQLKCGYNSLLSLPSLPNGLTTLICYVNLLPNLPNLPSNLTSLDCRNNQLTYLPSLPNSLTDLECTNNQLISLPSLPNSLIYLNCVLNQLTNLPNLPNSLTYLDCSANSLPSLPSFPNSLSILGCNYNELTSLPSLPNSLTTLECDGNQLTSLPSFPNSLSILSCSYNELTSLPSLPNGLTYLGCYSNNFYCLPYLPKSLANLSLDTSKIKCLPNATSAKIYDPNIHIINLPLCNPTNNPNQCQAFPVIQSFIYNDANSNNKLNPNEFPKHNIKLTLSNNNNSYTNTKGVAYINADSLGTYTITAIPPKFYNAVPPSYTHTFNRYDTLVIDTFALQPTVLKDSISIKLTPTNWAARAGFKYPFLVSYENVGTTVLSNGIVGLQYDNSLLGYDSSSNSAVTNSGSNLSLNIGNVLPGQTGNFMAYFTVKTTAALGSSLISSTNINTASVAANDTCKTLVIGSYDPNDKQATPLLTTKQVTDGNFIDYTIRFQNTGTDTAFNVVIADTLDSKLQANQVQIIGSSHTCKTTLKDNVIFFEFLDILLPDSNKNKIGSNGFVSFKIKPVSSLTSGTNIPNKAAIYFDYNSPIITKAANTLIQNPLPLQLLSFKASPTPPKEGLKNWSVIASWTTLNEVNTSHFILLRSDDGIIYKSVGSIAAKGFGEYNFIDNSLSSTFKTIYYQLKMVDKNGQFTFSNVIKINSVTEKLSTLIVLKNPAKNTLQLQVNAASLNNTTASLMNNEGKVIKIFTLKQGFQTIDISGFACGVYYLKTIDKNEKVLISK